MCSSVLAPALMPIALTRSMPRLIEQREDVAGDVRKPEDRRRIRRSPVAAQIGSDDAIAGERLREDVLPVIAAAGEAVEQQQRLAGAVIAIKEAHAVHFDSE